MTSRDGIEIEEGDWVVGGLAGVDRDAGEVIEVHSDGTATVAWEAGACRIRDRMSVDCDVYNDRRAALVAAFGEERVRSAYGI
jgi:hypothetical protein